MKKHAVWLGLLVLLCSLMGLQLWRITSSSQPPLRSAERETSVVTQADPAVLRATGLSQETAADATFAASLQARLKRRLEHPDARAHEAVLTFKSPEAYQRFLARVAQLGLHVIAQSDAFRSVRVHYDDLDGLERDLLANGGDYGQISANFNLGVPPIPENRAAHDQIPLGNNLLSFLGVTSDNRNFGRGVTLAVLDSGVAPDATFGLGRLRTLDIGLGTAPAGGSEGGHGTAVAALAAGMAPDAPGVAPAADVLSIRVADDSGKSDLFTVSQGILAAVDAGAKVINVSLGGYQTGDILNQAIDYATQHGAVIVASAGNDQAAQLAWPAADPRVVSVGAVDAVEQQVLFSNSGPQLKLTAPGYGVQTAWTDGQRVLMDGTSASAPIVAGAIAAVLSQDPSLSAADAARIVQQYADDNGPAGADPDYGHGVVNLGWALARNDPTRFDTAVSSLYYNSATGNVEVVVQNRSGQAVAGLTLDVDVNGTHAQVPVSWVNAGATQVVQVPVSASSTDAQGRLIVRTQLNNPAGTTDQFPANNQRAGAITLRPPVTKSGP